MSKHRVIPGLIALMVLLVAGLGQSYAQGPGTTPGAGPQAVGTAFTYQGLLTGGDTPYNGSCDLRFTLYNDPSSGSQVGPVVDRIGIQVTKGLFTITDLDFGANVFTGNALWLEVAARCPSGSGGYVILTPRQPITAAPYASYSSYSQQAPWSGIVGMPAGFADNVDDDVLGGLSCAGGQVAKWNGTAWACAPDDSTAYGAGIGLYIAGTNFGITTTYRLPQGCTANQVAGWNGSAWDCAADNDTTYQAGTGLSLAGTTLGITTTYRLPQSCTDGYIPAWNNALGLWECAVDSGTTYSAGPGLILSGTTFLPDETYLQLRVTQACTDGYSIRQVNQDGSVACQIVDNTTYQAGAGLYLAGTTFGITTTYQLPQGCNSTEIAKWSGSAWTCAADAGGVTDHGMLTGLLDDDHPQYFALAQNETVTGTPAFNGGDPGSTAPFTVDSTYLVADLNADLLDGRHSGDFQAPVTGTCSVGSTIRAINADGTVVCQPDAPLNRLTPPQNNVTTTPDSAGNAGFYTSVTIGSDGLPLISYDHVTDNHLRVVHCTRPDCSTFDPPVTLDSTCNSGQGTTSITIGRDGLGLISYFDVTNGDLKVAHCNDVPCSSATLYSLDGANANVGSSNSITIGQDGLGLISYYDDTYYRLKVAHCSSVDCITATVSVIDSGNAVGGYSSITIAGDGRGLISYWEYTNGRLKAAHCNNVLCTSAVVTPLDDGGGYDNRWRKTAITTGADGRGLIAYGDWNDLPNIRVAHCTNLSCSAATYVTINASSLTDVSVTVGADGLGLITYNYNGTLVAAHCNDTNCTSLDSVPVDGSNAGHYNAVTIGVDGLPVISHYDATNLDLKVTHCASAFCLPYFRRR